MLSVCMSRRCKSEAEYSIKALVPACGCDFYELPPVEVYCGLLLCRSCASGLKWQDVINDEIKDNVTSMMMARHQVLPDFPRSKLQIISCNDLQLLMLEARHATIH